MVEAALLVPRNHPKIAPAFSGFFPSLLAEFACSLVILLSGFASALSKFFDAFSVSFGHIVEVPIAIVILIIVLVVVFSFFIILLIVIIKILIPPVMSAPAHPPPVAAHPWVHFILPPGRQAANRCF